MSVDSGVKQDFSQINDVKVSKAVVSSGFLKPNNPVIVHPGVNTVALTDANITTVTYDMIKGYYYESAALTANRTLTLPSAANISAFLISNLKIGTATIPGLRFDFVVDNTQAGAFTRTLVAGVGVTLQGTGFDVSQNEIAMFNVHVHSSTAVSIARSNLGPSAIPTLAEVLVAGNVTGGTDIVITAGDSITGAGQVPVTSSLAAANSVLLNATNAAGGVTISSGTGGFTETTTGAVSISATGAASMTSSTGAVTVSTSAAAAGGIATLSSAGTSAGAVVISATNAAGGIDVNAGTNGIAEDTTGPISLDAAAASNFSTTTGALTLASTDATAAGVVAVNSSGTAAGAVAVTSAGGITADANGGGISLDATAASNFSTTTGALTLASTDATAAGVVTLNSAGTGVGAINLTSAGGMSVLYAAASTATVTSGGTIISTFGTAAAPDLTVNNGNLEFATVTRGIASGPTNGVIAANAVTASGTAGSITDSAAVAAGSRAQITVTNAAVVATSQIFIQVSNDATVAQSASLLTNVIAGAGSFTLDVFNTDAVNATTGTPVYHYFIVNPA